MKTFIIIQLLITVALARAEDSFQISGREAAELQRELIVNINKIKPLDFIALPITPAACTLIRIDRRDLDVLDLLQSIQLVSSHSKPLESKVYTHNGRPVDWTCGKLVIYLSINKDKSVNVSLIAMGFSVAVGKGFNIHTFSFTPYWVEVPADAYDLRPIWICVAEILKVKLANLSAPRKIDVTR